MREKAGLQTVVESHFDLNLPPKSGFLDPNECNFSFTEAIFLTRMLLPSRFSLQNGFLFFLYIKTDISS